MKTVYYYQTFVGLDKILNKKIDTDVIIISSIHFNKDKSNIIDIYLNDNKPDDKIFNQLWTDTKSANDKGITIMLMMGGAGLAYKEFFSNINQTYPKLVNLIKSKPWIKGIDLDIEEYVDINNVKILINKLVNDFGDEFIITMAPIANSLITNDPGMGSFCYNELFKSDVGKYIHWFNVQCYNGTFNKNTIDLIIKNNYPVNKLVMGMMSGDFNSNTFNNALTEVKNILNEHSNFGGVFDWEYFNAPPDVNDPSEWARLFKALTNTDDTEYYYCNIN